MRALDILVHVRQYQGDPPSVRAATALARRIDARLHGLYVAPIPPAAFTSPETVAVLVQESDRRFHEAQSAASWWNGLIEAAGARGDWQVAQADALDAIVHAARWNDLIVIERPQLKPEAPLGCGLVSRTVFGTATPLLVVPEGAQIGTLGERVAILWNGSREAIRAVHGALPVLEQAASVVVIDGEEPPSNGGILHLPRFDLRAHLVDHGVNAVFKPFAPTGERGAALLAAVRDSGADLVVMGAWGHSRIAELVLGGATRHLFQHTDKPLLVAH